MGRKIITSKQPSTCRSIETTKMEPKTTFHNTKLKILSGKKLIKVNKRVGFQKIDCFVTTWKNFMAGASAHWNLKSLIVLNYQGKELILDQKCPRDYSTLNFGELFPNSKIEASTMESKYRFIYTFSILCNILPVI